MGGKKYNDQDRVQCLLELAIIYGGRWVPLTTKRACAVLGKISADELCQLVVDEKIEAESTTDGRSENCYQFAAQAVLDYVFSGKVAAETVRERILRNKKDPARQERGRRNRTGTRN